MCLLADVPTETAKLYMGYQFWHGLVTVDTVEGLGTDAGTSAYFIW